MSSPVFENDDPLPKDKQAADDGSPTSVEGTLTNNSATGAGQSQSKHRDQYLRVETDTAGDIDPAGSVLRSPSQAREEAMRLDDELAVLQAERVASRSTAEDEDAQEKRSRTGISMSRSRSRRSDAVDEFDEATNPLHEKAAIYNPPEDPHTSVSKFIKKLHNSSFIVRYFTYIVPIVALLLIPLLLGALVFYDASVGGVRLLWFSVWLEIVWLTLWAGRVSY